MSTSHSHAGNGDGQQPDRKQVLLQRFYQLSFSARFLTISLFVHVIIVIVGGGAVLIKTVADIPDFEAPSGEGFVNDDAPPAPPAGTETERLETTVNPTAMVTAPTVDALTSAVTKASFSMPSMPANAVKAGTGDLASMAKGLAGKGTGVGGVIGGTRMYFGSREKLPAALVGTFYDLKQDRRKKPTGISPDDYHRVFREFVAEGWREGILSKYFRSPNRLYATQILIPNMSADEGPKAFDMQKEVQPSRWLVHYQGRVSPPADATVRFVGAGDDVMIVRFNGKVVLDRCWYQNDAPWKAEKNYDYGYTAIPNGFARGDAIKVRATEWYDIEVLIGEQPGGLVFFSLLLEEEGVEYQRDDRGNPILPVFRLADTPPPEASSTQKFPPFQPTGPVWRAVSIEKSGSALDDFFGKK